MAHEVATTVPESRMRAVVAALLICAASALGAAAQTLPQGVREVTILGGWRQADGSRLAAVAISLAPGWHTYWRVPGDAGIPPTFDWSGSRNLARVDYEWPHPEVFELDGMRTIGYAGTLVLPVRLTPADPGAPLDLALAANFGVCSDICVPADATAAARIAPGAPDDGRPAIEAALAARARTAAEAGVVGATCSLEPSSDGIEVEARVTFAAPPAPGQVAVLESDQPGVWIGTAASETRGRTVVARAPVEGSGAGPVVERRSLRLTVLDDSRAVDIEGCAAPG
ncbi:MAG: protein-disulfide reductase DsbD family protein [Amaricoccus sp.]